MKKTSNTPMTKQEKEQLGNALWDVANVLRGGMPADEFRNYMLPMLFYRYISAQYESAARQELGSDLPEGASLLAWYKENEVDVPEFEDIFQLCRDKCKVYGSRSLQLWLAVCSVLGPLKYGRAIWNLMGWLIHPIKKIKAKQNAAGR